MAEYTYEKLEELLKLKLGDEMPERAMDDIHEALKITEKMEAEGFSFKLEDLSRGSLTETDWRATLSKDGNDFSGQSDHAALAVCVAVADALQAPVKYWLYICGYFDTGGPSRCSFDGLFYALLLVFMVF